MDYMYTISLSSSCDYISLR